jgi:hypothetical protein
MQLIIVTVFLIIVIIWLSSVCKDGIRGYWLGDNMYFIDDNYNVKMGGGRETMRVDVIMFYISIGDKKGFLHGRTIKWTDGDIWNKQGIKI